MNRPETTCLRALIRPASLPLSDADLRDIAFCRDRGILPVLAVPGEVTEAAAAEICSEQIRGTVYRVLAGQEEPVSAMIGLCRREGIPLDRAALCRSGRLTPLTGVTGQIRGAVHSAAARIVHPERYRAVEAAVLCRVSEEERAALLDACARADTGRPEKLLIVSQMAAFDKGSCAYLKKLLASVPGTDVLHLSETPALSDAVLNEKLSTPFHNCRYAAFPLGFPPVRGKVPEERRSILSPGEEKARQNLTLRFPSLGEEEALALCLYLRELFSLALDTFRPTRVMMWNAFTAAHLILADEARSRQIPLRYMEFGLLPGTMGFDRAGQMGASSVASLPAETVLDPASLERAGRVLRYLAEGRQNRNAQYSAFPGSRVRLPRDSCGRVLLIGQSDYESGLVPWDEEARRDHSPFYASTLDMVRDVAPRCLALGYTPVFRPHPAMAGIGAELPDGTLLSEGGDLFALMEDCDLVVTLMSQVSYEALLHGHNVLQLGRSQLTGKGCVWERQPGEDASAALEQALKNGRTPAMREAFRHHVAWLLDHYVWDDLMPREIRYGLLPEEWKKAVLD